MPIEIRELNIRVTVNEPSASAVSAPEQNYNADIQQGLVKECIEQVFEIINSKKER